MRAKNGNPVHPTMNDGDERQKLCALSTDFDDSRGINGRDRFRMPSSVQHDLERQDDRYVCTPTG